MSCAHFPQFFQISIWGPKCPFTPVPILPCVHLGKMDTIKVIRVPLSPKSSLFLKTPSANFPFCPFAKILGEWAQSIWGTPFLQMPICPLSICKNLGEMGTEHLWYPVRAPKVPFSPKRPSAHLPWWPYANIWGNGHRALGVPL